MSYLWVRILFKKLRDVPSDPLRVFVQDPVSGFFMFVQCQPIAKQIEIRM